MVSHEGLKQRNRTQAETIRRLNIKTLKQQRIIETQNETIARMQKHIEGSGMAKVNHKFAQAEALFSGVAK